MAEIVGSRLQQLIADRDTNQSALARAMGISQPSVGRLITGETRETGKLLELARALRTTPEYLVGYSDEPDLVPGSGSSLSPEEWEVVEMLQSMSSRDRAAIIHIMQTMAGRVVSTAMHAPRDDFGSES
jgi:transcriptional regulator with XRE-family HTH domain